MAGAFVVNAARQVTGSKRFLSRRAASRVSKTNVAARAEAKEPAKETTFFAGDIGGTNARLQVWQVDASGGSTLTFEKTYSTSDHPTFESCVADLYKDSEVREADVSAACFAVAGPVADDRCAMTNIEWVVDGPKLAEAFDIGAVKVINDFAAAGTASWT